MKKILIFQHVPHESPGYIQDYTDEHEIGLDIVELWKPYEIPAVQGYAALIILGGPMGVYENFPSEAEELGIIKKYANDVPMLGVCLGSQLIAHAFGAPVYPNEKNGKKTKEIGYYEISLTEAGRKNPLFKGFPSSFEALEWHGDAFDIPEDGELLASTPLCANQSFNHGSAYGTLFHFEFTEEMIAKQIEIDKAWTHAEFDLDEQKLMLDAAEKAKTMREHCFRLLDNFLVPRA